MGVIDLFVQSQQQRSPIMMNRRGKKQKISLLLSQKRRAVSRVQIGNHLKMQSATMHPQADHIGCAWEKTKRKYNKNSEKVAILLNSKFNDSSQITMPTSSREASMTVPESHIKDAYDIS